MRINTTATVRPSALRRIQNAQASSHDQHSERNKRDSASVEDAVEDSAQNAGERNRPDQDGLTHIDTEA